MVKVGFILVPVHQASTLWLCPAAKFRQKYFNTGCKLAREPAATRPVQRKKERNHRNFFWGAGDRKTVLYSGNFLLELGGEHEHVAQFKRRQA